jgi:hypothetical protein
MFLLMSVDHSPSSAFCIQIAMRVEDDVMLMMIEKGDVKPRLTVS